MQFFPFHPIKYVLPLPSGLQSFCREVSWYPYGDSLVYDSLFFFLPHLEFFLHILLLPLKYSIYWCGYIWVHLVWDPLCFLYLDISFILQVWELFGHNFFKYFLIPFSPSFPSGTPVMLMLAHLLFSQRFHRLLSFFFLFIFLLFSLYDFHYSIFQITYVFFCIPYLFFLQVTWTYFFNSIFIYF